MGAGAALIEDTDPRFLNDKNSMTADPNDANYVYAVWDRLQNANADTKLGPAENRVGLGFKGPIYFTRTTNGGDSWEPARKIWESGANKQALGDQIAVLPASRGGDVLDFFSEFLNASDRADHFPRWLSLIRSTDKGASWGKEERVDIEFPGSILVGRDGDSTIDVEPVPCPDPTETGSCPIRSGDFIPDVAVDQRNGNLYAVWMDLRFDGGIFLTDHDNIAFTMSTDGGRTWSPTIKVNQTPDDRAQLRPAGVHARGRRGGRRDGHRHATTTSATTPPARRRSTPTTSPCTATPAAPARRAGPGTRRASHPPRSTSARRPTHAATSSATTWVSPRRDSTFFAVFGQAFTQNNANQYVSRLAP